MIDVVAYPAHTGAMSNAPNKIPAGKPSSSGSSTMLGILAVFVPVVVSVLLLTNPPLWWNAVFPEPSHQAPASGINHGNDLTLGKVIFVHADTAASPRGGGQATGVQLDRGQVVAINASGKVVYGYEPASSNCPGYPRTDPAGNRISSESGLPCGRKIDANPYMPSQTSPVGSLLWRIGDSGWAGIGPAGKIIAPETGQLYLCVNDDTIQDNSMFFYGKYNNMKLGA
jgi:hypothetical protein